MASSPLSGASSSANANANRLRFHPSPTPKDTARYSIISSSAKGWSPLQINKRDSVSLNSPLKPSPNPSDTSPNPDHPNASPRRTSSSFKHVTTNSLVSNSPFKSHSTAQGQQAAGGLSPAEERVIHERRSGRMLGQAPVSAAGVASTPKAYIGLGISAQRPRSTSRSSSGSGAAITGTRRVSTDRTKAAIPAMVPGERRTSGGSNPVASAGAERKLSGSKENESPDVRAGKKAPRTSGGLKGLAKSEYVSRSPFKQRVPSGGGLSSSSRHNESPSNPSPKTIPVQRDDLFGSPSPSPSPNRVSSNSKRRPSPSSHLVRQNSSPTPSPPRAPTQSLGPSPSPLGQQTTLAPPRYAGRSPSPLPVKSSLTPSRRLRGPRLYDGSESPTRSNKTVTFQSVPDVKEFERMSIEGSADGSFELDKDEDDEDWADDINEDSLDDLLTEPMTLESAINQYRVTNPDSLQHHEQIPSPARSTEHDSEYDPNESTTADFMDTLIQEGLFSPPEMSTPAFEDQPAIPIVSGAAPCLSTPSFGDSISVSPMFPNMQPEEMFKQPDTDDAGIPYGRTHHIERNVLAHSLSTLSLGQPIEQPDLPHENDHHMLLNANAAQPSLVPAPASHLAHQSGPMPDPFITLQTATKVLSPPNQQPRQEGGIPLGRTSHQERMVAARMLATQSLGLGMPRSPAISKDLTRANSETMAAASALSTRPVASPTPSPDAQDEGEMLFDASFEMNNSGIFDTTEVAEVPKQIAPLQQLSREDSGSTPRRLPRPPPPRVEAVKVPSPIVLVATLPAPAPTPVADRLNVEPMSSTPEKRTSKYDFSQGFTLPSIGFTSPLFSTSTALPPPIRVPSDASVISTASSDEDEAREGAQDAPLTPPRAIGREVREDSPHRIPSFDFDDLRIDVEEDKQKDVTSAHNAPVAQTRTVSTSVEIRTLTSTSTTTTSTSATASKATRPVSMLNPTIVHRRSGDFGPGAEQTQALSSSAPSSGQGVGSGSATTKVRQRISREMIRETIQQRKAQAGTTLTRNSSTASGGILDAEIGGSVYKRISMPVLSSSSSFGSKDGVSSLPSTNSRSSVPIGDKDKDLPPPPPTPDAAAVPMRKAHTTEAAVPDRRRISIREASDLVNGQVNEDDGANSAQSRPMMRPRSQTQSAHEVLRASVKDGVLEEPKSGLDRLIGDSQPGSASDIATNTHTNNRDSNGLIIKPVSILRKPESRDTLHSNSSSSPATAKAMLRSPIASPISPVRLGGSQMQMQMQMQQALSADSGAAGGKDGAGGGSRRKGRRSMSTGDVGDESGSTGQAQNKGQGQNTSTYRRSTALSPRLTLGMGQDSGSILDSLREDMSQIGSDRGYRVREKQVAKARYDGFTSSKAGDLDAGKAWRSLRRPSDMNEHAAELKRMRALEADVGKTSGTIFVKVLGIESLDVPLPQQDTFFCVTLDNGIDYIRTPYTVLKNGARVNQEFSLVEQPNFEFSLSLDIRRDPHILKALHEKSHPPPAPSGHAAAASSSSSSAPTARGPASSVGSTRPASLLFPSGLRPSSPVRGIRALFGSPRKARAKASESESRSSTPLPPQPLPQPNRNVNGNGNGNASAAPREIPTIAKYLVDEKSCTLAKTHIAFEPIAKNCQAKVLEMRYPMFAMFKTASASGPAAGGLRATSVSSAAGGGAAVGRPLVAKITLQIFRLPPLPGIKAEDLPQCIDEALRGMRHHAWHEHEYHEGVLTQEGGDCSNPKRRMFKLIGGNLVAINEVTKKQVASIDLRQATTLVDLNAASSPKTLRPRNSDEGLGIRPRSWALEFKDGDSIVFQADKDEDKTVWMETLNGLIGKIPSNPLWAELLASQRRDTEAASEATATPASETSDAAKRAKRMASSSSMKMVNSSASGQRRKSSSGGGKLKDRSGSSSSGMKRDASGVSTAAAGGARRNASGMKRDASAGVSGVRADGASQK